jgi:glycosyltransferase involved in cell wall biosynthesis
MKVLLLTRFDRMGASSRMRTFQYLPHFESSGWQVSVSPLFSDVYLKQFYNRDQRWRETALAYLRRIRNLIDVKQYDLIWIEKELLPFLPATPERMLKRLGIPYVVDFDDALFHRYDQHRCRTVRALLGRKIDAVMKCAAIVVAGNLYLARRAYAVGAKRVEVVPTVVDLARYSPCASTQNKKGMLVIGWIGTPWTSQYLLPLKQVFKSLKAEFDVKFVAVGASPESVSNLPVEAWPWSEASEVHSLRQFDIGIMPLPDTPFARHKCGYKLIQYMACGIPVVASPIGVNNEIVEYGVNGFLADGDKQWRQAFVTLLGNAELRWEMGRSGREKVECWYSLQIQAPRLKDLLLHVI